MAIWARHRCHECGAKIPKGEVRCARCTPNADAELGLRDRMLDLVNPEPPDDPRP